jgi:hypothetical protein
MNRQNSYFEVSMETIYQIMKFICIGPLSQVIININNK